VAFTATSSPVFNDVLLGELPRGGLRGDFTCVAAELPCSPSALCCPLALLAELLELLLVLLLLLRMRRRCLRCRLLLTASREDLANELRGFASIASQRDTCED